MKADSQTLRIATWNLKCFGTDRLSDKNVLDVVCVTILKNKYTQTISLYYNDQYIIFLFRFDFIAFQELADPDVLKSVSTIIILIVLLCLIVCLFLLDL